MKENIWYFYGVAYETEDEEFNDFISAYYILKDSTTYYLLEFFNEAGSVNKYYLYDLNNNEDFLSMFINYDIEENDDIFIVYDSLPKITDHNKKNISNLQNNLERLNISSFYEKNPIIWHAFHILINSDEDSGEIYQYEREIIKTVSKKIKNNVLKSMLPIIEEVSKISVKRNLPRGLPYDINKFLYPKEMVKKMEPYQIKYQDTLEILEHKRKYKKKTSSSKASSKALSKTSSKSSSKSKKQKI